MWIFCEKGQFLQSFGRNSVKFKYYTQSMFLKNKKAEECRILCSQWIELQGMHSLDSVYFRIQTSYGNMLSAVNYFSQKTPS